MKTDRRLYYFQRDINMPQQLVNNSCVQMDLKRGQQQTYVWIGVAVSPAVDIKDTCV